MAKYIKCDFCSIFQSKEFPASDDTGHVQLVKGKEQQLISADLCSGCRIMVYHYLAEKFKQPKFAKQ